MKHKLAGTLFIIVSMVLLTCTPSMASEGQISLVLDTENWPFREEKLEIIMAALEQRDDGNSFALHAPDIDGLMINFIVSQWNFLWQGKTQVILENSVYSIVGRQDVSFETETLSYSVYDENGESIFNWSGKTENNSHSQVMAVQQGEHMTVEILTSSGDLLTRDFQPGPYAFGETFWQPDFDFSQLTAGQEIKWIEFDQDILDIYLVEVQVEADNLEMYGEQGVRKLNIKYPLDDEPVIMYIAGKRALEMDVGDFSIVACDVATALEERSKPVLLTIQWPLDIWLPNMQDITGLELIMHFTIPDDIQVSPIASHGARQVVEKIDETNSYHVAVFAETVPERDEHILNNWEREEALAATDKIQSDAPEIQNMAEQITAGEADPLSQVLLLAQWVADNIKTTYDIIEGSALDTLDQRRGDCTENSYLFTALARALGIPARPVSGWMASMSELTGHMWAEVYLDRWVEIDPSYGQLVNAFYIRGQELPTHFSLTVRLADVEVQQISFGSQHIPIDKTRPYWIVRNNKYYNRVHGLSMDLPEASMVVVPSGDGSTSFHSIGAVPPGPVSPVLFMVKVEPFPIGVTIGYDYHSHEPGMAEGGVQFGVSLLDQWFIPLSNTQVSASLFKHVGGENSLTYFFELGDGVTLGFTLSGVQDVDRDTIPPVILAMYESAQLGAPDIGPGAKTASLLDEVNLSAVLMSGSPGQIRFAIAQGADVNASLSTGRIPLLEAALYNPHPEVLTILLDAGADVNRIDNDGMSALTYAVMGNRNPKATRILLEAGAQINTPDEDGKTPLMWAAEYSANPLVLDVLLEGGADINARDHAGLTPLFWAAKDNLNPEIHRILLEAGADINARDNISRTPLMWATGSNRNPQVIGVLLDSEAELDAQDQGGRIALTYAARFNENPQIVITLLNAGADGASTCHAGNTPYDYGKQNPNLVGTEAYQRLKDAKIP